MKKIILIISVLSLTSCAKRYTWNCTCDVTGNNSGTYTSTIHDQTEGDADYSCKNYGREWADNSGSYSCTISKK